MVGIAVSGAFQLKQVVPCKVEGSGFVASIILITIPICGTCLHKTSQLSASAAQDPLPMPQPSLVSSIPRSLQFKVCRYEDLKRGVPRPHTKPT